MATKGLEQLALKVTHIWLYVRDTQRAMQFYRDTVGFEIAETFPDGALFKTGSMLLGIHREEGERKSTPGGISVILLTKNIEKSFEGLKQRGVEFLTPIKKEPYGFIASFADPDGYLLEIWQPI